MSLQLYEHEFEDLKRYTRSAIEVVFEEVLNKYPTINSTFIDDALMYGNADRIICITYGDVRVNVKLSISAYEVS